MRLKFAEILELLILFLSTFRVFEDDDSSRTITKTDILSRIIKTDDRDDIFLHNFLIGPFVAEDLRILVIGSFTEVCLLHVSSINLIIL